MKELYHLICQLFIKPLDLLTKKMYIKNLQYISFCILSYMRFFSFLYILGGGSACIKYASWILMLSMYKYPGNWVS